MNDFGEVLEVRYAADPSREHAGILKGVLLEYEKRAADRPEAFAPGALSWPDDGVLVNEQHRRDTPIARVIPEVRGNQVTVTIPVPDTTAGRDLVRNVKAGVLKGLSVEFRSLAESVKGGLRWIEKATLGGIGVVGEPAYREARVEARNRKRRVWL